ncbi:uncharacterized protein VTP21DRAFT_11568 [Calcarisporiella thermophila]|uniref:uncharacterized protein n=1 Tax=Calcarisporiella thermophila TaxID=911321 RepID=UPI0037433D97
MFNSFRHSLRTHSRYYHPIQSTAYSHTSYSNQESLLASTAFALHRLKAERGQTKTSFEGDVELNLQGELDAKRNEEHLTFEGIEDIAQLLSSELVEKERNAKSQ